MGQDDDLQRRVSLWIFVLLTALGLPVMGQVLVKSEPLAEVEGEVITAEEVDKQLGTPLARLQEQIYDMRCPKLEALIGERLLAQGAAKRGLSV
jgi:hypothetical protein